MARLTGSRTAPGAYGEAKPSGYYGNAREDLVAAVGRTLRRKLRTFGRAAQPERGHSWRPRPVALPIAPGDARPRDAEFPRCMAPHLFPPAVRLLASRQLLSLSGARR